MPGTITFKPIEANLNHDTDLIGKADPYCMFTVGGQKIKGQTCKSGGKHPVWQDSVTIPATNQTMCLVEVKDKDILKDDKMGSVEIDLREIESQGRLQKWFPLSHKGKPAGELLLEAVFTPDAHSQGMHGMPMGMPTGLPTTGMPIQTKLIGNAPVTSNVTQKTQVITKETHLINNGIPLNTHQNMIPTQHQGAIPTTAFNNMAAPVNNMSYPDQYAQEALIRGVDPLGTHLNHYPQQMTGNTNFIGNQPVPQSNLGQAQGIDAHNYGTFGGHHHNQQYPNQQMTFGHGRLPNNH